MYYIKGGQYGKVEKCPNSLKIVVNKYISFSDDHWDNRDAQVVCRMLGYNSNGAIAKSGSTYGSVPTNFVMDDVHCIGTEETLEDCNYSPTHNCGRHEGAGVICRIGLMKQINHKSTSLHY